MLYTVWINFGAADLNADAEANAIINVYRLAEGLPDPQRTQVQKTTRAYADVVVNKDWPARARGDSGSLDSHALNQQLWRILMSVKVATPTELTAEDHAIYELSVVAEHRRTRRLQSTSRLPAILWFVLIVGGGVTIMSSCMFGASNNTLHAIQVFFFSLLIALVLVAIADIDRPFQGVVHVSDPHFVEPSKI
jgi:hypothetical protein